MEMDPVALGRLIQKVDDLAATVESAVGGLVRRDVCAITHVGVAAERDAMERRVKALEAARDSEAAAKVTAAAAALTARRAMFATIVAAALTGIGAIVVAVIGK